MISHLNIRVSGCVQGVCFRAATRACATTLGLDGFVKNEPDGSVYIEAEGTEDALHKLVEWCHHGPPSAVVENVVSSTGKLKNMTGFTIRW